MSKQVVHFGYVRTGRTPGSIVTGTVCGRETLQSDAQGGGVNSTDDVNEVTCKLCLKHPRYLKAKS